ncbi:MAG: selenocysteine-specific translation elongation factor [Pirellulaceae bacterium]|jgi:selenocysteine-specific elongation factor|nr:selenocysteine-specific translation elongation factor [Pirellulaceae bacterium]
MAQPQINITLGTAGHIDHGKTALVKSLTGCETDRLREEKERGMSIDLGYAPCAIGDLEVGIVDVPGHEHFVKTMVAGAAGMDGVILVVAADDGVMPQTREHLDILTLLGIRHGLVALTKVDRVAAEDVELAQAELADFVQGTFLDGSPILPVSNVTGQGYDRFYEALQGLVGQITPKATGGVFRLPVDRAFSVQGFGTVVAGIPVCGQAHLGDEVVVLPHQLAGRLKRIEVYGRASDTVLAGQCAAVNVGHWESDAIRRGDTVTLPGYFSPDAWYVCRLRLLPRDKLRLKQGGAVKFHTGTTEVNAAVYSLEEGELREPGEYLIQVRTQTPIVAGPGDHFILRSLSPTQTIGGGTIVEAVSRRLKRTRPMLREELQRRANAVPDDARFVEYCIRTAPSLTVDEAQLAIRAKVLPGRLQEILAQLTRARKLVGMSAGRYMHRDTAAEACARVLEIVEQSHTDAPESPGMTWEQLKLATHWDKPVLDGLIVMLKTDGRLVERNQHLALPTHQATFAQQDARHLEAIETLFRERAFQPPDAGEIVQATGIPQAAVEKTLKLLREHGRLIWVGQGLLFHVEAIELARQRLVEHIRQEGRLESVKFKYLVATTRKYALPLLDYFDRTGLLRRDGNTRYLKSER